MTNDCLYCKNKIMGKGKKFCSFRCYLDYYCKIKYEDISDKGMLWYVMGFHLSDGDSYSYNKDGCIRIKQSRSKENEKNLQRISKWFDVQRNKQEGKRIYYDTDSLTFCIGATWLKKIYESFGYVKMKGFENVDFIDEKYKDYFLAGIIDGDGCIYKAKNWRLTIACSSIDTAKNIKRILEDMWNINCHVSNCKCYGRGAVIFIYNGGVGNNQHKKIVGQFRNLFPTFEKLGIERKRKKASQLISEITTKEKSLWQ